MERSEFLEKLDTDPISAFNLLQDVMDAKVPAPWWMSLKENGNDLLTIGAEVRVITGDTPPEPIRTVPDASFEVPIWAVFMEHLHNHQETGVTHVLHRPNQIYTVHSGVDIDRALGVYLEYDLNDPNASIPVNAILEDDLIQVFYMAVLHDIHGDPIGEPEWILATEGKYTPKEACNWTLRGFEFDVLLPPDRDKHESLLGRAKHRLLYEAAKALKLEQSSMCEVLQIPADRISSTYGFSLCAEMTKPEAVVRVVRPSLKNLYSDDIIQQLLTDVGVDMEAVARLDDLVADGIKPVWPQPDGTPLLDGEVKKQCPECGNRLVQTRGFRQKGARVPVRCPRCWLDDSLRVEDLQS